jgi:hypothetical protein
MQSIRALQARALRAIRPHSRWLSAAVLAAGASAACQSATEPPAPPDDPAPLPAGGPLVPSPEHDLGSSVPSAALAFVADVHGFRGGYLTHVATVSEGIIDLTPRHFDRAQRRVITGGAVGLATAGVFVGSERVDDGAGRHEQRSPNVVHVQRGDVVEQITNREDGIEQSWIFAAAPPAGDDLVVEVSVAGHDYVATTATGLHFRSPAGLGVRYSHALWRDAAGTAYDVPVRFEDGRIRISVPEAVVQAAVYPAVLDPTVTAELFTDVPATGTTGANNRNQDVASDGSGYFVVWQDQRDDRGDDIFGARVTAGGTVTDAVSIRINNASGTQQSPAVAFVGTGYVVAWENVVATGNSDIEAAFVSASGAVTQLGTIANTSANETGAALAGRGSSALLTWGTGADIRGALFSAGAFGASFAVAASGNLEEEPAVSASPTGDYLVTFTETVAAGNRDIRGQRVTAAGGLSGAALAIADDAGVQSQSAAAFDGTNYVVVWTTGSADIAAARVSAAGVVLDATPVTVTAATNAQLLADVACTAAGCLVAWQDARNASASVRDIYGAALSPTLAVTAADLVISGAARAQDTPAIAVGGSQYFATWSDNRDLEYFYVRGTRMTGAGAVQDAGGLLLAGATSRHGAPALAQSTSFSHVLMSDSQAPDVNLVHARFQNGGAQQDATPKLISGAAGVQVAPAAAILGGAPFAVWEDTRGADRDIYGARINTSTGLPVDAAGLAITTAATDQFVPAIASAGTSALVVWQDRRGGVATGFDIYAALVNSAGAVTVADLAICAAAGDQLGPAVAYDATTGTYLVVWTDPSGATVDIRGARVSAAGALLDGGCGAAITTATGSQFGADLAFGDGRALVVWEDRRNDAALGDIYGARVTLTGGITVQDPAGLPIAQIAGSSQAAPTVAFTSGGFAVAWADARNSGTTGTDLWGAQVAPAGTVAAAFAISATTGNEGAPDLVAGPYASQFSVAYTKQSPALGTTRMQFRRLSVGTVQGQRCTQNSQCESGFCADGFCCSAACGGSNRSDCQACSVQLGASANGTCTIVPAAFNYICRDYAVRGDNPQCDVREYCNGTSAACPADLGQRAGLACVRAGGGTGTCPAADASGAPHFCR